MFIAQLETLGLCLTHCVFFGIRDIICVFRGTHIRCSHFFLPIILSLQRFASNAIVKCDRKAISVKITFSSKYILFSANNSALIVFGSCGCFWQIVAGGKHYIRSENKSSSKLTKCDQIQMKQNISCGCRFVYIYPTWILWPKFRRITDYVLRSRIDCNILFHKPIGLSQKRPLWRKAW